MLHRLSMTAFVHVTLALCLSWTARAATMEDYAFFSQSTVASHRDGCQHRWPCMARLSDTRILLTWSRAGKDGEDAIMGVFSTDGGCSWRKPAVLIANDGWTDADPSVIVSGDRVFVTCTAVKNDGINTSVTWCVRSEDSGATWSAPYTIEMNHRYTCGKTHRGLRLKSGTLVMGYSWEATLEKGGTLKREGDMDLHAGVMLSTDSGKTWTNGGDAYLPVEKTLDHAVLGTDEPAIVELPDGSLYMLIRTGGTHLYQARSTDEGRTWHDIKPSPLLGTNAPAALSALDVHGRKGIFAVWDNGAKRFPLCAAASFDGGQTWTTPVDIGFPYTGGQASYPSCLQTPDGALLAVWQHDVPGGRDIRLARFSLAWLEAGASADFEAPLPSSQPKPDATLVLFGDSTTNVRGPLQVFGHLLKRDLPQKGLHVKIVNAGVGGNTTAMARKRFEKDVLSHSPDVVTIGFGINDSAVDVWKDATASRVGLETYEGNIRYFIEEIRKKGGRPILLTPNPLAWTPKLKEMYGKAPYDPDSPDGFNVLLRGYAEKIRAIAEDEKVPLVDTDALFRAYIGEHPIEDLLLDGMHPNDLGHRMIADQLLKVIPPLLSKAQE